MKKGTKILSILIVLSFVLMAFTCTKEDDENHHYTISFYNNTDTDLYVIDAEDYPDTTATHLGMLCQDELYKVKAHSLNRDALVQRTTYESIFNDKKRGNIDTLMVFVFDAEKLDTIESDVHVKNAILVRYDLSLKDLQQNNWTITYPPTDAMKNVKMYLPYSNYIKK